MHEPTPLSHRNLQDGREVGGVGEIGGRRLGKRKQVNVANLNHSQNIG